MSSGGSHFYTVPARAYFGGSVSPFAVTPATTSPVAVATPPISLSITGLTANAGDDLVLLVGANGLNNQTTENITLTAPSGFTNTRNDFALGGTFSIAQHSCD